MALINAADAIYLGAQGVNAIYAGSDLIWERQVLSAYDETVLADAPTTYWPCSETGGSIGRELVNGWDGTYQGGVILGGETTPDGSPAPLFNGANGYLQIPNTGNRLQPTNEFSVELWFRSVNYQDYDTPWGIGSNNWDMRVDPPGSYFRLHWYGVGGGWYDYDFTPPTSPLNGNWHHYVVCRSSSLGRLIHYWNGVHIKTASILIEAPRDLSSASFMSIGAAAGSRNWGGPVCRVAHYARMLTDIEVANHYSLGSSS